MKIAISCDHRGAPLYHPITAQVERAGHELVSVSACSERIGDYPDFAYAVAHAVAGGGADRGILMSGWGVGMAVAANKLPGVRAAVVEDELLAQMCRRHLDANVLCLPVEMIGRQMIAHIITIWLSTEFEGGRHARRVEKIRAIEAGQNPLSLPPHDATGREDADAPFRAQA